MDEFTIGDQLLTGVVTDRLSHGLAFDATFDTTIYNYKIQRLADSIYFGHCDWRLLVFEGRSVLEFARVELAISHAHINVVT